MVSPAASSSGKTGLPAASMLIGGILMELLPPGRPSPFAFVMPVEAAAGVVLDPKIEYRNDVSQDLQQQLLWIDRRTIWLIIAEGGRNQE